MSAREIRAAVEEEEEMIAEEEALEDEEKSFFSTESDPDSEDEDEAPRKKKFRRLTKDERAILRLQREQLFRTGSEFKHTERDEIIGIDNVLGEIEEIIHWLVHSEEYDKYNSRLQPGVIFSGSPGTGKTLVSRWVATESNALFVNVRDFKHTHALLTASDISDLFNLARETYLRTEEPIVLFWDEFENAAQERGAQGTTQEQKSVVSQLTAELDGIHGKNKGILLIGCTNYADSVDQALRRRGRMGVHIEFHAPDRAGKEKILAFYLNQFKCEKGIDFHTLSYFFPKYSTAADIEEACVEAWRHAVRRSINTGKKPYLSEKDLVQVFIKQLVGPPTTFILPDEEKMPIALHESGHAIVAMHFKVPVRLITVQPGKKALGRVMTDDPKEYVGSVNEIQAHMRVLVGGIAAERTAGLEPMTGSTSDIKRLTQNASWLVNELIGGKTTGIFNPTAVLRNSGYTALAPHWSNATVEGLDWDVKRLVKRAEQDAYACLERVGSDNLHQIAEALNKKVTMTGTEFKDLFIDVCGYDPTAE